MDGFEEDEDVVLEGSAFHRMLQDAGCTDFEPIVVHRHRNAEESQPKLKMFERLHNLFKRKAALNAFDDSRSSYLSEMQIATILRAETLLVDHAEFVQSLLEKNSLSFWSKLGEYSTLIASTVILGTSYLIGERKTTRGAISCLASLAAALVIHRRYNDFRAITALRNLIGLQNELHRLYKKGLRIMSKQFALRPNSKQASSGFSNLEGDRLKYIQPLTETLLQSLSSLGRIYYETTLETVKILPKDDYHDFFMHFDDQVFTTEGEIIYNHFRSLYYVYMLVQSDAMKILAVAYDRYTWKHEGTIPRSQLNRVICNLCRLVENHGTKLARIIENYENCKPRPIQRTFRGQTASRWKDLYLNLDLLSRKVASTYDAINSAMEDIDNRENVESSNTEEFVKNLKPRIHEIHKQIDSARNFAEFSELLIAMLNRSGEKSENGVLSRSNVGPTMDDDRPIVFDADPQIIDEVFEEYITEEYLKSFCNDENPMDTEMNKYDKLLAKNFMIELKDALVDKCKSMNEREAKALSRKNRKINGDAMRTTKTEERTIPRPPPLLAVVRADSEGSCDADNNEIVGFRLSAKLPREINAKIPDVKDITENPIVSRPLASSVPPPPPPPPPPPTLTGFIGENENFTFDLSKLGNIGTSRIPAFVNVDEEFFGSGENSEEEIDDRRHCDDDADTADVIG